MPQNKFGSSPEVEHIETREKTLVSSISTEVSFIISQTEVPDEKEGNNEETSSGDPPD
jgi:hypothetical protein